MKVKNAKVLSLTALTALVSCAGVFGLLQTNAKSNVTNVIKIGEQVPDWLIKPYKSLDISQIDANKDGVLSTGDYYEEGQYIYTYKEPKDPLDKNEVGGWNVRVKPSLRGSMEPFKAEENYNAIIITDRDAGKRYINTIDSMESMFEGVYTKSLTGLENLKTDYVTKADKMFYEMRYNTELDLTNVNLSKVESLSNFLRLNSNLLIVNMDSKYGWGQIKDARWMFGGCNKLESLDLSMMDFSKDAKVNGMFEGVDRKDLLVAYTKTNEEADMINGEPYGLQGNNGYNRTVVVIKKPVANELGVTIEGQGIHIASYRDNTTEVEILSNIPESLKVDAIDISGLKDGSILAKLDGNKLYIMANGKITTPRYLDRYFMNFKKVKKITGLENIDVKDTIAMNALFKDNNNLTEIGGLHTWKPDNLQYTRAMFSNCTSLSRIDLSAMEFNHDMGGYGYMSKGTDMFFRCNGLTTAYAKRQIDADKLNGTYNKGGAKFIPKTTIILDSNGTGEVFDVIETGKGKQIQLPTPSIIKPDHVFKGWSIYKDDHEGVMKYTVDKEGETTLYAVWYNEKNTNKITLNYNYPEAKNGEMNIPIGSQILHLPENSNRKGYDLVGWSLDKENLNMIDNHYIPNGNMEIYAKWEPTVYTIKYELYGGTLPEGARTTYTIEDETFTIDIPTLSGRRFSGWNDKGYKYRTKSIPKGSTGNITLYAKWDNKQNPGVLNEVASFGDIINEISKNEPNQIVFLDKPTQNLQSPTYDLSYNYDNSVIAWVDETTSPKTIFIEAENGVVAYQTEWLFADHIKNTKMIDISKLNLGNNTSTQYMFNGNQSVEVINMDNVDVSKITNTAYMFNNATSLKEIKHANVKFENTTNIYRMFRNNKMLNTTFTLNPKITNFNEMVTGAFTDANSGLVIYWDTTTKEVKEKIEKTIGNNPRVTFERTDKEYKITYDGSAKGLINIPGALYEGEVLSLTNEKEQLEVISYVLNGELKTGSTLVMPSMDISISDVKVAKKGSNTPLSINKITLNSQEVTIDYDYGYEGQEITLTPNSNKMEVVSFIMNGALIKAGRFTMPNAEAVISDVVLQEKVVIEESGRFTFTAPEHGIYKLEVWGAQGGSVGTYEGGYGSYSTGEVELQKGETIYIHNGGVGAPAQNGESSQGGYNGGGGSKSRGSAHIMSSGGGATHIAKVDGLLKDLSNNLSDILIVAGGGGGAGTYNNRNVGYLGHGGGHIGHSPKYLNGGDNMSTGGTQTSGGGGLNKGSFGQGAGNGTFYSCGGGGGLYGGGSHSYEWGGAGGSGYIANPLLSNKAMYAYDANVSNDANTLTYTTDQASQEALPNTAKKGNGAHKITLIKTIEENITQDVPMDEPMVEEVIPQEEVLPITPEVEEVLPEAPQEAPQESLKEPVETLPEEKLPDSPVTEPTDSPENTPVIDETIKEESPKEENTDNNSIISPLEKPNEPSDVNTSISQEEAQIAPNQSESEGAV